MAYHLGQDLNDDPMKRYIVPLYNPSDYYRPQSTNAHSFGRPETPRYAHERAQQGYIPPPPPGPPPQDANLARMHSVVREIAVVPTSGGVTDGSRRAELAALAFRQPARSQAPLPLRSRELALAAPKVPTHPIPQFDRSILPPTPPIRTPPFSKHHKPAPLNIGLAEGMESTFENRPVKTAPMRRNIGASPTTVRALSDEKSVQSRPLQYPKTAGLPGLWTTNLMDKSVVRRMSLSPLDTQITPGSRKSALVDFILSPSLLLDVSNPKSPISHPSSDSRSPSLWSPQTPRAMAFENNSVVVEDTTPPMPTLEWLDDRRDTIIEEDIQDATPLEAEPPRGRILAGRSQGVAQERARARSMSPPASAYPKESAFSWDLADLGSRPATDDDLYSLTPIESQPMIEDVDYKPLDIGFDARATILGSYFKRQ